MSTFRVVFTILLSAMCLMSVQTLVPQIQAGVNPLSAASMAPESTTASLNLSGPALVDSAKGQLYVVTQNGTPRTAVFSTTDGRLLRMFDVGGPMALDSQRNRLYVSTQQGVLALDAASGTHVATLPVVSAGKNGGSSNSLPPFVDLPTGTVLVVNGPKLSLISPDSPASAKEIPFTVQGYDSPKDEWLIAQDVAFDPDRRSLYGKFVVHSQSSQGIGGNFAVYRVLRFDMATGQTTEMGEVTDLDQWTVEPRTGDLIVTSRGEVRQWAGQDRWLASLDGLNPLSDQSFPIDPARQRIYASTVDNRLVSLDLVSLEPVSFIPLPAGTRLLAYDLTSQNLYLASAKGQLQVLPATKLGNTLSAGQSKPNAIASPIRALDFLPDGRLAAQPESGGIHFSSDNGKSWQTEVKQASALAISPTFASDRTLLAAIRSLGLFRSTDGGNRWTLSTRGLQNLDISQVVFSPTYEADHTAYAYTQGRLNMYGYPSAGDLYRSTDGGQSWRAMPQPQDGLEAITLSDVENNRYQLVAATAAGPLPGPGVLKSSADGGTTWQAGSPTPAFPIEQGLSLAPLYDKWGVGFIFGTDGILYRTADHGRAWTAVLNLSGQQINWGTSHSRAQIAYAPDMEANRPVFLVLRWDEIRDGTSKVRGALYLSWDGGQTWTSAKIPGQAAPTAITVPDRFVTDQTLYLGMSDGQVTSVRMADLAGAG